MVDAIRRYAFVEKSFRKAFDVKETVTYGKMQSIEESVKKH